MMIDTDQLVPDVKGNRQVFDLSTPELARGHGLSGPSVNYASNSREVLLEGRVPPHAMTEVSEADLRGACK